MNRFLQNDTLPTQQKSRINIKGVPIVTRSITPINQSSGVNKRIDILNATFVQPSPNKIIMQQPTTPTSMLNSTLMNNTQLPNGNSSSQSHLFINQPQINSKNARKGQPTLNIDSIDEQESHYCLEQLISPNFQPQSALSMQKRLQKQHQVNINEIQRGNNNSNSTTKFQMSGNIHFFGSQQNESSQNKYSSTLFRKNSTRSSRMESPSCNQHDNIAESVSKGKNKQKNVRKIMNDSLNMITKSRNKYLNKSFQQNNSSSSATRIGQTSFGGDTTLNASGNQHLSLKKMSNQRPGAETSMKKLNSTASYDILGVARDHDNLDHSYGKLGPDIYNKNSSKNNYMRSPHSFAKNWSNQNTNTLNSNNLIQSHLSGGSSSINIMQSQISQKHLGSSSKINSSERDQMSNKQLNNINFQSNGLTSNMSTTNKKNTFKFNFKSSIGCSTGMMNTPLGRRSQYITNQNGQQNSQDINCNDNMPMYTQNTQDYQTYTESSNQVSPLSSLPKRQLNFNTKGQNYNNSQLNTQQQNQINLQTTAPTSQMSYITNPQIIQSKNHKVLMSQAQQLNGVRPFQYCNQLDAQDNQHSSSQKVLPKQDQKYLLDNIDQNDFIDPNLFYQQQAMSTTSQLTQSNDIQLIAGNKQKQFKVPKISKLQLQQSFHHQPLNHGCLSNNHKASQQQFLSMGENSDFSQEPTIKRSLTPSSGQYSIKQLNVNQSGQTEKCHQIKQKRKQTNQNFQQLQLIEMQNSENHQLSIQNQTFHNINNHDDSLMMMLQSQNNLNNSQLHNQPLSGGEDISFNIDCSQAFQLTNQTIDRPMTVGDINNSLIVQDTINNNIQRHQTTQTQSRVQQQNINNNIINSRQQQPQIVQDNNLNHQKSRQINESLGGQSENLETSRFSTTIETQMQQNTLILTNQNNTIDSSNKQIQSSNTNQDYSQSQRFLKVAPNANQIKLSLLNQVNQRKIQLNDTGKPHLPIQGQINATQRQFFSKVKGNLKNEIQNEEHQKDYIKQLKQDIQNRRDQQMRRNQELFSEQNLSTILNNSSFIGANNSNVNKTKVTGSNIFILNSAAKQSSNQTSNQKTVIKRKQCKHHSRQISYQKRDMSADNLLYNVRRENGEFSDVSSTSSRSHESSSQQSSQCSCISCLKSMPTSKLQHLKQDSSMSSSFLESSQQVECKECLDSKCQSRLCCQCNDSERCSKLSKIGSKMSKQKRGDGMTSGMSRKQKIRKDKDGRQYIKYKDNLNNQVYRIDAPNNVFFDDDLNLTQNENNGMFQHRGRQLKQLNLPNNLVDQEQNQSQTHNLIPIVKRNLTPDDHLRNDQPESYILVDQKGKPRKIYIQRNVPIKVHSPGKDNFDKSKTIDYEEKNNTQNVQQFSTIQNQNLNKTSIPNIQSQRKKFFNGTGQASNNGDSSLICCLSTKSQRDYSKYDSTSKKSDTSNRGGRCLVQ